MQMALETLVTTLRIPSISQASYSSMSRLLTHWILSVAIQNQPTAK